MSFRRSVVSTLTCRFTFICRFFCPLKGLPFNTLENYGMASWWPVKFRSNAVFQGLILCVFCLKCMIVYHADAKSTLKSSIFAWKLLGQRGPGALSYRVLSGNIGVVSEFENRQSRQFCMKTKMKVEKARREAMHMSWKVHDIERFSNLKWAIQVWKFEMKWAGHVKICWKLLLSTNRSIWGQKNLPRMGELRDWPGQSVRFWGK